MTILPHVPWGKKSEPAGAAQGERGRKIVATGRGGAGNVRYG